MVGEGSHLSVVEGKAGDQKILCKLSVHDCNGNGGLIAFALLEEKHEVFGHYLLASGEKKMEKVHKVPFIHFKETIDEVIKSQLSGLQPLADYGNEKTKLLVGLAQDKDSIEDLELVTLSIAGATAVTVQVSQNEMGRAMKKLEKALPSAGNQS